jgi:hypothetical protein
MQLELGLKNAAAWKSLRNAEKIILLNAILAEAEAFLFSPTAAKSFPCEVELNERASGGASR